LLIATHTLELPLLQNAQQCNLRFRRQFTDLVKEDGSFFGNLEAPQPPLRGARKSPFS